MILVEEQTDLKTPTGPMRTYVSRPAARGSYPGVVLFSEIFQRTARSGVPRRCSPDTASSSPCRRSSTSSSLWARSSPTTSRRR